MSHEPECRCPRCQRDWRAWVVLDEDEEPRRSPWDVDERDVQEPDCDR